MAILLSSGLAILMLAILVLGHEMNPTIAAAEPAAPLAMVSTPADFPRSGGAPMQRDQRDVRSFEALAVLTTLSAAQRR